jgi:hypothetical protein
MSQPFGMTGVPKTCEMEGVLVGWGSDDGIDFTVLRQLNRGFDGMSGDAAGTNGSVSVGGSIAAAQAPGADGDPLLRFQPGNLVFRPDDRNLGFERLD